MNGRNNSSQSSRPGTATSTRSVSASKTLSADSNINRLAINRSAVLGSLYNASADCVLGQLSLGKALIRTGSLRKTLDCNIIKGDMFDVEHLFRSIGIDGELWLNLNLILNIVSAEGMAELIDYSFPKTTNTRFLYYNYTSEEKSISSEQNTVRHTLPKHMPTATATHIISTIKLGIQVFIVLQLSHDDQTNLDRLLQKIKNQLIDNKFALSRSEKSLLDGLIVTKVFSNTPELKRFSKLDEICQRIMQMKPHTYRQYPLEYTLRTIKWFYPSYSTVKARYIPLEPETTETINQYLFSLSTKINELKIPLNSEVEHALEEYFKRQYDIFRQQITDVQQMYAVEKERIRQLVFKMRVETMQQELILGMLTDKSEESLSNKIDRSTKYIQSLREKVQLIIKFNQQDIQYLNMEQYSIQQNDDLSGVFQKILRNDKSYLVFCTDDYLKNQNSSAWDAHYDNWMKKRVADSSLTLVYADFSYTSFHLSNTKILWIQSLDNIGNTEPSSLPISSALETAQTSKEQSYNTNEPYSPTGSPKLSTRGTSLQEKRSSIENTSPESEQLNDEREPVYTSNSPPSSVPKPAPRNKKQRLNTEKDLNSEGSSNPLDNERIVPMNQQTNYMENQCDATKSSTRSPPKITPRTQQHLSNSREPPPIEPLSLSEVQSNCGDEQTNSPELSIIAPSETASQTEKHNEETERQSDQLESPTSSPIEGVSLSTEPLKHVIEQNNTPRSPITSSSEATPRERRRRDLSRSPNVDYTNVLLLGESGVGKSTFINALVNYLTFEKFEQALSDKPTVVMPVSFLMTMGDDFKEQIVRFGGVDPNEDHQHPGQSVTQHCRSYVFQIDKQTKLRIIDTPGMGDTRGLDQDDLNIQHILSFINNLSHLNAICILLKPNESRLNIVLRSYFTRLLNFLGENARNNIAFCFTNTRATFYAPGNTGPLLREMIRKLSIKGIPFAKSNTFCFDSESFRYLIALQNGIEFDDFEKEEYKKSWTASVTESNRLLQYICRQLKSYPQNEWQSIEYAQFKISQIIRPMLETTRNIARNITLLTEDPSNLLIKLCPMKLDKSSAICYKCIRIPKRFSDFWILPDDLHTLSDKCSNCDCPREKHIAVNYELDYELSQGAGAVSFNEMKSHFEQLRLTIIEFGQFYGYVIENLEQNDPILPAMKRMINEESQICSQKGSTCLNSNLHNILKELKKTYEERRTLSISNHIPIDLLNVYEHIKTISEIDQISDQLYAIKQTQDTYMQQHEKQVL